LKTLVTGSSGLVGQAFLRSCRGTAIEPVRMVRSKDKLTDDDSTTLWQPLETVNDLPKAEAIVHLAGEGIIGPWSKAKKERMIQSRVDTTKALCGSLIKSGSAPKVMVIASGISIYGNRGEEVLNEESSFGDLFLSTLAQQWEQACEELEQAGTRVVKLRISVVLNKNGGALQKMLPAFKLGLGGPLGKGNQWMSWISLEDLVQIIHFALINEKLEGPVNACSPEPVTNNQFTKALGEKLKRPTIFRVPEFILKRLGGEMAENILLASTRAQPPRLIESGFEFKHKTIENFFENTSL